MRPVKKKNYKFVFWSLAIAYTIIGAIIIDYIKPTYIVGYAYLLFGIILFTRKY